jgi:hypothetical protein
VKNRADATPQQPASAIDTMVPVIIQLAFLGASFRMRASMPFILTP